MSVELISVLIAMLAVGATLGGLILTGNRGLQQEHAWWRPLLADREKRWGCNRGDTPAHEF